MSRSSEEPYWVAVQAGTMARQIVLLGPFTYEEAQVAYRQQQASCFLPDKYSQPFSAGSQEEAKERAPIFL